MRKRDRFFMTQVMKLIFQCFLYSFLFLVFFGLMSLNSPAILNLSRTAGTTMATFVLSMTLFTKVYGGFDIGRRKKRSVFSSITLAIFFTDLITYLMLQIMNTNPNNPEANPTFQFWGEDLALLFAAFLVQLMIIYLLVSLGIYFYHRINPPQKCCIITSSQQMAEHVLSKTLGMQEMFAFTDVIHYTCPDWRETVKGHDVIFIAGVPDTEEAALEAYCYKHHKTIYLQAELEDVIKSTAEQNVLDDTAFLNIHRNEMTLIQRVIKRGADIVISLIGLIITSPITLVTAAVLKMQGYGSVFFRQARATINGNIFKIIKFRTMYEDSAANVSAAQNDSRVTPVGRFLRKYRIDELPQLINVLKGEMSLVGPRPEMLENVVKYIQEVPEFRYRQQMKAGLTGLAQIEGKYNTSPQDKAILDLLYIENFSILYDFKLILRTATIFFRKDSTEGFGTQKVSCPSIRMEAKEVKEPKCAGRERKDRA